MKTYKIDLVDQFGMYSGTLIDDFYAKDAVKRFIDLIDEKDFENFKYIQYEEF